MEKTPVADEELARRAQNGDTAAFGELVTRFAPRISRYARKFLFGYDDAEDVAQEAFIRAYTNIKSFDANRRFSPWMYRIAHNTFINAIKKKGREPVPFFDPDTLFPHPLSAHPADRDAFEHETSALLEGGMDKLDPKYREPLVLYYFEHLDYREIAEVMRIPVATVGVRLKRGRERLKTLIDGKT